MKLVCKVEVVESERGWGSKVDDYTVCLTLQDAEQFKKEFNSKNDKEYTPDWYMKAESILTMDITDEFYDEISKKKNKRIWLSDIEFSYDPTTMELIGKLRK